ncbi:MAG: S-methyl-5-thioribose-1-phosphate isomerase [Proteobacteria bacterium]|nr:MAG: S-methyl-5-thioribose-1-phosphate isomerase [Pseudomonadota bacterium]
MQGVSYGSTVVPVRWRDEGCLELLDQRVLPGEKRYIKCIDTRQVADSITKMVVRGAPAIGIAAAYGVALSAKRNRQLASEWRARIEADIDILAATRPTAVNLFRALEQCRNLLPELTRDEAFEQLAKLAITIHQDDIAGNVRMGREGAAFISARLAARGIDRPVNVLTHCNTGSLATGGFGTALGVVRSLAAEDRLGMVYADETRPWLQGARLTVWELTQDGIPVTLNVDSAAAHLMKSGRVDCVIVGADRITANGDVANKIGTCSLAVLAKYHGISFYVAAPLSTIDPDMLHGDLIPIEEREAKEILSLQGKWISLPGVEICNPVFDVTPAELIDGIITESGVIAAPFGEGIRSRFG